MSILQRAVDERVPHWTCPDCGTTYFGAVSQFNFCPACKARKDKLEQEYWDKKAAGMRSVASDIVARILANK
jgi:uncharacterized Zn finger protein (UPF0148 family)